MAKIEDIKVIMERLQDWEFLKELPRELQGFKYQEGGQLEGHVLTLCSYVDEANHRRLDFIYTKETFDYMPIKEIGLHRFRDIRNITRSRESFEARMKELLPQLLQEIEPGYRANCQGVLEKKGISTWEYGKSLPAKIGDFELFISPACPLEYINNSIIFLDYVDFRLGNELVFLYNRVRNEFFAEIKEGFIPGTVHDFDSRKLPELQALLENSLEDYLKRLSEGKLQVG